MDWKIKEYEGYNNPYIESKEIPKFRENKFIHDFNKIEIQEDYYAFFLGSYCCIRIKKEDNIINLDEYKKYIEDKEEDYIEGKYYNVLKEEEYRKRYL